MWFGGHRKLADIRRTWGTPVVRERRLESIAASHAARCSALGSLALDERTWADLDLDAVFETIDRTTSTLGQHALYHRLRTAPAGDDPGDFEKLIEQMRTDPAVRERAQLALSRLQDPHGYDLWWLGAADALEPQPWYRLFPVLTCAALALALAAPFWHAAVVPLVALVAMNVALRSATDERTGTITRSFRQLAPLIATAESLRFLDDAASARITGPLQADVPSLARLKLVSRWTNGNPFMLAFNSSWLALALSDVVEIVYQYLNLAFVLDATGVYVGLKDLATHRHALLRVVAAAGAVDAAIGVASFRAGPVAWTRPEFRPPGSSAELDDLRHPLVEEPVPNSVTLRAGKGVLITGSNMSGKSTLLRTVGVNAVLAQTINTCLAGRYSAPVFTVRSCIGRSDDLVGGKSYYLAEVEALLGLVQASENGGPCLFLLDEMFRGTNAVERIAAGEAVLRELLLDASSRAKHHVALAATHDAELVDLLSDTFDAWHFGDSLGPDGLLFDHRLRQGPATTRNAIALLRLSGAPESLVSRATTSADRLDRERGVTLARR
jgi:hypothetical protein